MSNDPTTSPDASREAFRFQHPPSPLIDSDPDNCGVRCSVSDPDPQTSRRTSVQSVPGMMTDDGRAMSIANSVSAQDRQAPSATLVQRVGMTLSRLFKPRHKVGKAPGFTSKLRTILFGSCASYSPTLISAYDVLMRHNRA